MSFVVILAGVFEQ